MGIGVQKGRPLICSSVYLDFSISSFLPQGVTRPENSHSASMKI
jgi:hypothetical protein